MARRDRKPGAPVDARVPGEELGHPVGHVRVGLGGRGLVELDGRPLDAVEAGHELAGADQVGQGVRGATGAGASCPGNLHAHTLRDAPRGGTLRRMQTVVHRTNEGGDSGGGAASPGRGDRGRDRRTGWRDGRAPTAPTGDAGGSVAEDGRFDRGTAVRSRSTPSSVLDEVEQALARLDDGTYGRCEECGAPIDDGRLADSTVARG